MLKQLTFLLNSKRSKDLMVYGFGQAVNLITPLLIIPFIIFRCGEEGLGKSGISLSVMFILIVIIDYGSYIKGVKEVAIHRDDLGKLQLIFNNIYALKFALLCGVLLLAIPFFVYLPYFDREHNVFLLSLTILIGQFVNPGWFLQGVENFKWISITNIVSKILYVAGVLCIVRDKGDYIFVNLALGLGAIVGNGLGVVWIIYKYRFFSFRLEYRAIREIFTGDFKFCISQLFLSMRQYAPIIIVGFFIGNFAAGQYKVIEQIIMLFRTYLQMFFRFVYANICYEISKNSAHGVWVWKRNNGRNLLAILAFIVVLFLCSANVLKFFKIDLIHLDYLNRLLKFALVIPLLFGFSLPLEQLMFAFDKNKSYINITILMTLFNILVMTLTIRLLGVYSAISSIALTEIITILAYCYSLKKTLTPLFLHAKKN